MSDHIGLLLIELDVRVLKTIDKQLSRDIYNTAKFTIINYFSLKMIYDSFRIKDKIHIIKMKRNHPFQRRVKITSLSYINITKGREAIRLHSLVSLRRHISIPTLLSNEENEASMLHLYLPRAGFVHSTTSLVLVALCGKKVLVVL